MYELAENNSSTSAKLPARLEPMMLTHLVLTGDVEQHREWADRVETVRQMQAVEEERDLETRRLLSRPSVWRRMRLVGKVGALSSLALGVGWMALLIPEYAIDLGFGWAAALTYLLPVPIAWKVGRRLWERAALAGMRDLGPSPPLARRVAVLPRALLRSAGAGFGFGFTLVFLQGLISAFMTPEPTLVGELIADGAFAAILGSIAGSVSAVFTPFVSQPPP